ncbi:MAG TPA: alpha/beta fold hydrolase [Nitrososphaerales archaeon]|nr:alpha/beta fold hydrolase [Nitrososphaerales archaeon]
MADIDVARLRQEYQGPHETVSTSDGKTLFVRRWNSKREAPVSVLVFHGITGYSGPYGPIVADQLSASGFEVFCLDLRGHGMSDGKRGDYPSHERLIKDLTETISLVKSKSKQLIVMGHSLGVLSAVLAVNNYQGGVQGVVLSSAARKVRTEVFPKSSMGATLKALMGVAIFRGAPVIEYRRTGQSGLGDPLFNFRYSARFYSVFYGAGALKVVGMFRSGFIDSPHLKFDRKLQVPLMVAVGDQDELFSTEAVKEFYDSIDCDDKEFHVIPGAKHAVFPKDAWTPLVTWLGKKF